MAKNRSSQSKWLSDLLRKLFKKGWSDEQIANELNYAETTIRILRCRLGLHRRKIMAFGIKQGAYDDKIFELYNKGHTGRKIADALNCCASSVCNRRRVIGLEKNAHMSEEQRKLFVCLYQNGISVREIARQTGIYYQTVDRLAARMCLSRPDPEPMPATVAQP